MAKLAPCCAVPRIRCATIASAPSCWGGDGPGLTWQCPALGLAQADATQRAEGSVRMNAANHRPEDLPGPTHDLRDVTEKLRLMRTTSLQQRYSGQPAPALPSRAEDHGDPDRCDWRSVPPPPWPGGSAPRSGHPYVETMLPQIRDRLARQIALELMLDTSADPDLVPDARGRGRRPLAWPACCAFATCMTPTSPPPMLAILRRKVWMRWCSVSPAFWRCCATASA